MLTKTVCAIAALLASMASLVSPRRRSRFRHRSLAVPVIFLRTATLSSFRQKPRVAPTFCSLCVSAGAVETPNSGNFRDLGPPVSTSRLETSSSGWKWRSKFCVRSAVQVELLLSGAKSLFIREFTGNFRAPSGVFRSTGALFRTYFIGFQRTRPNFRSRK